MSNVKIAVTERRPDGSKWTHYFESRKEAEAAVSLNKEAHPHRSYEVRELA